MTLISIQEHCDKLEDRTTFCKAMLQEEVTYELARACKVYLQYQNDNAWKMVESAHEKWRKG